MLTPPPIEQALGFVRWLVESSGVHWLGPAPSVWDVLDRIVSEDRGVRSNLVPDAYLAALCLAHGATIATADRGFARFEGLKRLDPTG